MANHLPPQYRPSPSIKFRRNLLDMDLADLGLFPGEETQIDIENVDTIGAALKSVAAGERPLVLNMANNRKPGGGFLAGARAQEEHMFRCSNYFMTLKDELYPLVGPQLIYSPKVFILRDENYNDLPEPVPISCVAVAATNRPHLFRGHLNPIDRALTLTKIKMIHHLGAIGKHDTLILGALGCGAFYNPPGDIAKLFSQVAAEYAGFFKRIIFAIKCDDNNPNCDIFQRTFRQVFEGQSDFDEPQHNEHGANNEHTAHSTKLEDDVDPYTGLVEPETVEHTHDHIGDLRSAPYWDGTVEIEDIKQTYAFPDPSDPNDPEWEDFGTCLDLDLDGVEDVEGGEEYGPAIPEDFYENCDEWSGTIL